MAPFAGDRAPYALIFLAVVIAAVLGGWRSGLVALITGQLATWYVIVPPNYSFALPDGERTFALAVATVSQLLILVIIALYQREIDKGVAEREKRMALLDHALNEIDHRTRNNHQTVLAMIHLQAQRSTHDGVREALHQVADRIQAIAQATERLALRSGELENIRLDDHLCGLCEQIERGLSRQNVNVRCEVEEITTSADMAIPIAIIVNELVTNSAKHAFGPEGGTITVTHRIDGDFGVVHISDDGRGIPNQIEAPPGSGQGSWLLPALADQIEGTLIRDDHHYPGTGHILRFPLKSPS
jgi:two-component sensor histidine kinase